METVFRGKKVRFKDPIISERIRRLRQVCDYYGHEYKNNKIHDKWELQTSIYAQKYPDQVQRELKTLVRVKILPGQFELDQKGTIDEKGTVKEALVYTVQERVTDPSNPATNVLSSCSHKMGIYQRPLFSEEKDDFGNVTESKVQSLKNMFYIRFEPEVVKKILEEFSYQFKGLALAVAQPGGPDSFYAQHKYKVYDLNEFLYSDFDSVREANEKGFLRKGEVQGVQRYLKDSQEKKEKAEREFKEFRERQQQQNQQQERGRGKK